MASIAANRSRSAADSFRSSAASRVCVAWRHAEPIELEELAVELTQSDRVLCIVNLKRHAARLARAILECIKAGVDVDFPVVYRALAPLEAIAQAAGRCNRHGQGPRGRVVVFKSLDEKGIYPPGYRQAAGATETFLAGLATGGDLDATEILNSPTRLRAYFQTLYALSGRTTDDLADEKPVIDAIRSGKREDLKGCRYCAVTLSANSGRVVIRDWMEAPFEELVETIAAWFDDLSIVSRDGKRTVRSHKFGAVLAAPVRDLKDAPPALAAALWRCALKGHPIPHEIMAQTLSRVRIDLIEGESPRHARFGLLKAFCIRNERILNMTIDLNDFEIDPAYLCGRIMAIVARIQRAALGDVGAGVVQRYYAAARATPALVLGRLVRTAQIAHLPKIEGKRLQLWFDNQLRDAWNQLQQAPPTTLGLEGQTLFAMGLLPSAGETLAERQGKRRSQGRGHKRMTVRRIHQRKPRSISLNST